MTRVPHKLGLLDPGLTGNPPLLAVKFRTNNNYRLYAMERTRDVIFIAFSPTRLHEVFCSHVASTQLHSLI